VEKKCVVCENFISGQKQKYCSNKCKQKDHYHKVKSQSNTYHSQTLRSLKRKLLLIEQFGGKCENCGYNQNIAALHFHHLNPNDKNFKLDARNLSNKKWENLIEEAKKCALLCSNCHAETHNPELELENVKKIICGAADKKLSDGKGLIQGNLSG